MANGPQRLILIRAGRYDYADVELSGAIQIVGLNNTGKTTLINTLQFLYIDDQRSMNFGSYTMQQTREYYFPSQYSYVLFEVLGVSGKCVLGWRGQSSVAGGEPERFVYDGPYDPDDFVNDSTVREPKEVNSRLGLKRYRSLKNAHEQRELLLWPTKGDSRGIGIVALRNNDRYPQFRETLKNLLSLNTISQDQMRTQLMMLAGLSTEGPALDVRQLFGESYDGILRHKDQLRRFKKCQEQIERVVAESTRRDCLRGELLHCWGKLKQRRYSFEQEHERNLENLKDAAESAARRIQSTSGDIQTHHRNKEAYARTMGALSSKIEVIEAQEKEFAGFMEQLERSALKNLSEEIQQLQAQLDSSETETLEDAKDNLSRCKETVERTRLALACFDRTMITALRRNLSEEELAALSRLFNFDILELLIGEEGVLLRDPAQLARSLQLIGERILNGIYQDSNIVLPLPSARRKLSELGNAGRIKERLLGEEKYQAKCIKTLAAIEHRDSIIEELTSKREQVDGAKDSNGNEISEGLARRLFRYEEYQKTRTRESQLKAELKRTQDGLDSEEKLVLKLDTEKVALTKEETSARESIRSEQDGFASKIKRFNQCSAPNFSADEKLPDTSIPDDFAGAVDHYNDQQRVISELDQSIIRELHSLERDLGPDFSGIDESETIRLLREELEALPEREAVLRHDWDHQLTDMQATFDGVLKSIDDIRSAADRLNRDLLGIRVSNLSALHMEVLEQTDIVSSMRRLVQIDQPGLFDESTKLESAVSAFRKKFEASPLLYYSDLFTLQFTVTGEDGKSRHYQDFSQVESTGTTITIKVLFNLLVLRSLLREDSQQNLLCDTPFFLDEIHSLDAVNRHAILATARKLGFIAITAAPESVPEVDALYFLQPQQGRITLRNSHRMRVMIQQRGV